MKVLLLVLCAKKAAPKSSSWSNYRKLTQKKKVAKAKKEDTE
jgi:hypothetical protein